MKFIVSLLAFISFNAFADSRVRTVVLNNDDIATVRTSLGIATIVQVPDRPNSVVVGDQEAFKVEYLDNAITIKPLHGSARSNLYVYTDWRRWNVQLVTGSESIADYVVYLKNKKEVEKQSAGISWTNFKNHLTNDSIILETKRLGKNRDSILIIEFSFTSKQKITFKPEWLWVTQNGLARPIQQLFLSDLSLSGNSTAQGMIQLQKSDIDINSPLRIEIKRDKSSYLTIPKVASWK